MTAHGAWQAPTAPHPVSAHVAVPGSKSLTNRVLALAAIAGTPTTILRPLHSRDTMLMAQALRALGVDGHDIDDPDPSATVRGWVVEPRPLLGPATIDCGLAGTVMRFVPALAALADGPVAFDGDARARERPVGPILDALRSLGVRVDASGPNHDRLPFAVLGTGRVAGGVVDIDASASSQFVSALLLAGCRFDNGVTVRCATPPPSLPHIRMTVDLLRRAGVPVDTDGERTWRVEPATPDLGTVVVEPDLSNAMPFVAAALVTAGTVVIDGWPDDSLQPDGEVRTLITSLGGAVRDTPTGLEVTGLGAIRGGVRDMGALGELVPTVAALATMAGTTTTITGAAHLRGHETDRLAALADGINALGGDAVQTSDGLTISPRPLRAGLWRSHDDHRMATAGAIIGLRTAGIAVDDIDATSKTLPGFADLWAAMLDAPRGAG
jgi:3-phosphoshikimate 1-carboxyvinyltransferase